MGSSLGSQHCPEPIGNFKNDSQFDYSDESIKINEIQLRSNPITRIPKGFPEDQVDLLDLKKIRHYYVICKIQCKETNSNGSIIYEYTQNGIFIKNGVYIENEKSFLQKLSKKHDKTPQIQTHSQKTVNSETISSCLLYTSPSPRDGLLSRMPSSA